MNISTQQNMLNIINTMMKEMWWKLWEACNDKHEIVGVIVSLMLTIFAVRWLVQTRKKTNHPLPPGPRGLPIVGYLPFLGTDLHREFSDLAKLYGPIYKVWLGNNLSIVISSPNLVKQVVRDQDIIFANRDPPIAAKFISYGANDIGFSSYDSKWKKMRKVFASQMLSNTVLDNLYDLRREEVNKSINQIYENIGSPINFGDLASSAVINSITSMICGGSVSITENKTVNISELRKFSSEIMVLIGKPNISDVFRALARFDIQGIEKAMKKVLHEFDLMLDSIIEQRRNLKVDEGSSSLIDNKKQRTDFLQFLLQLLENEDTEISIETNQLKALLMDIVVGGTDTTITVIEWVMTELMNHPEEMKKVQEELAQVVGMDNLVQESHLPKLSYLDVVVKETLRLHPALPFLIPHCPSQNSIVGGYMVPKGTKVFLNLWAIHRDSSIWEKPLEFIPQRFISNKFDFTGNNFQYLPFGSGRRICAGLPLAERSLFYTLASFLHSFNWELPVGVQVDLSDKFGIVTKKKNSLIVIPKPRLADSQLYVANNTLLKE